MNFKCQNLPIYYLVFSILVVVKQCEFVDINSTEVGNMTRQLSYVPTECMLPDGQEAYCVTIHDCLVLLDVLNVTAVRERRCGPSNENRKRRLVCCEKNFIQRNSTSTTIQPPSETQESPQISCGLQTITTTRILGGEPSTQGEFPWLARILRRDDLGETIFSCSGVLISSRVVLTAAHCVVSPAQVQMGELHAVALGEHETQCSPEADQCLINKKNVIISRSVVHPSYNVTSRNHDNDIALIILRDAVRFTNFIAPICLLENNVDVVEYYVGGWGITEEGSISTVKLKTALPPYAWEQCVEKYGTIKIEISSRQICAGGVEKRDSCQGDSGGPLMIMQNGTHWYVAGIVSFGLGCGKSGWPGVYVNVPSYISWIKSNIRMVS